MQPIMALMDATCGRSTCSQEAAHSHQDRFVWTKILVSRNEAKIQMREVEDPEYPDPVSKRVQVSAGRGLLGEAKHFSGRAYQDRVRCPGLCPEWHQQPRSSRVDLADQARPGGTCARDAISSPRMTRLSSLRSARGSGRAGTPPQTSRAPTREPGSSTE